ncbi:leucine-rich repeat protein, partial [Mycoplasma sp. SH20]|uniref:leucine-rich repeat protein n=1 Tax=Mycoplasma sp. SH20 TaxID=3401672 RepID=UPI003AAD220D
MKRKKLFILLSLVSASSIIIMPLVAGSCDNKNNDNKTEPTPIVTPGPNPGTAPKPSPVTKPGSGKKDNNIYSFLYTDGNKETSVKYYENENRILIPQAQDITSPMLEYIFDNLENKFYLDFLEDRFILECPNAVNICYDYSGSAKIKKLILPKIENIINNEFTRGNMLSSNLEDEKVIQNGILFKWNNASGEIEDNSVKKIIPGVFENNQNITSVSFPNVTRIGNNAFSGATNLNSVNMPKLKEVGYNAFESTPELPEKIVLNGILVKWSNASGDIADDTITSIAGGVFENNSNIASVSFPNVTSIGDDAFKNTVNLTLVDMSKLKEVGSWAFYNTPKLTNKMIVDGKLIKWNDASGDIFDDSITSIVVGVFENNEKITSVSFPNVTNIGFAAFRGATSLTSVDMPKLEHAGLDVFNNTPKLPEKIVLNGILVKWSNASGDIADDTITSIAGRVFETNQNITSVSFPNVKSIGSGTFFGATNLTSVDMPKLKEVGSWAFYDTPKLTGKIVVDGKLIKWGGASGDIVDDSITSVAYGVFENNQNITSVSFPNVTSIGDYAFKGSTNLNSVNMPKLKEVGYNAFESTPELPEKIVLNGILVKWSTASGDIADDTITSIAGGVFENNSNIASVSFPNVTSIGGAAFKGATNLTSVSFPNVTSIGSYAFKGSTNLTSVSFPNVTIIGRHTFNGATSLASVSFPNVTSIGESAFAGSTNLTSVSFPNVTRIRLNTFKGATNLASVSFPNVTSIGNNAFEGATNLASVSFPNVTSIG